MKTRALQPTCRARSCWPAGPGVWFVRTQGWQVGSEGPRTGRQGGRSAETGGEGLAQNSLTRGDSLWEEGPGLVDRKLPSDPQEVTLRGRPPGRPTEAPWHTLCLAESPEGSAPGHLVSRRYIFG